jgi:hypothetical protein
MNGMRLLNCFVILNFVKVGSLKVVVVNQKFLMQLTVFYTIKIGRKKEFSTSVKVDETIMDSPTHKVDCYKNRVALEIEWNNKDPFFDRDLNNFRLLFDLRVISVGVIITRCDHLQNIFNDLGRGSSYGASTTHMSKLLPRIKGGSGAGCPILVFGISNFLYDEDC